MENLNHPKKGSHIAVEPIRRQKDIKLIKKILQDSPRNLCLFTLGINTNLRASDLLKIKVEQVRHLQPGEEISLKEKKTQKQRRINLNRACIEAIQNLLKSIKYEDDDFLFLSNRKDKNALTVSSLSTLVKKWCKDINLKGNYASHTLRKTWGYHQRVTFGVGIPELMVCFNHTSQKQTLDYLCVQPEEIKSVYQNEL
ncbi:tyrosine-type recombinase/integrase [Desulfobacter sp. UBA2225]|uniref:tyrosine-type recombinase/integrase n=1 Tax=Desulfobacter sp. UBA2225 TaxID=1961413 RepID=UPI0025808066|nr:tyrosine-type recombinase/integrase [Desulfobacter sp. UBA2225]